MIYYFSGTGNTRWAAEQIAQATGEQLTAMTDAMATGEVVLTPRHDERIGFCFPVHGWQPPHLVRQFVSLLTIAPQTPQPFCFAVCTCGDSIGRAMNMFAKVLGKRGLTLHSSLSLIMPESYVCLPFMYTDTPQREQQKIQRARQTLDEFMPVVKECRTGIHQLNKGIMPWTMSHVIGAYFNSRMITDRKFRVDATRCIHCGRCQQVCPTGNVTIAGDDRLPQWHHDGSCTCCLACYHHCPRHAIDYGRYTPRRGQYYFKVKSEE